MLKRILLLLVVLPTSALAQNIPAKTTLIKAGRALGVDAVIIGLGQAALLPGLNELKRVKFVMKGGEVVKNELPK